MNFEDLEETRNAITEFHIINKEKIAANKQENSDEDDDGGIDEINGHECNIDDDAQEEDEEESVPKRRQTKKVKLPSMKVWMGILFEYYFNRRTLFRSDLISIIRSSNTFGPI